MSRDALVLLERIRTVSICAMILEGKLIAFILIRPSQGGKNGTCERSEMQVINTILDLKTVKPPSYPTNILNSTCTPVEMLFKLSKIAIILSNRVYYYYLLDILLVDLP